jgi:hypothetical protein
MTQREEIEVLKALLTTIIVRAGGRFTVPVTEVLWCRRLYTFDTAGNAADGTVTIGVRELRLRLFRPFVGRKRKRSRGGLPTTDQRKGRPRPPA